MNLAQALKRKNRLVQNVSRLQHEIQRENSSRVDNLIIIKVEELMTELDQAVEDLIKIKIVIFVAGTPMRENILKLSELKSKIVFIQGIDTKEGNVNDYGDITVQYIAVYNKLWVRKTISDCEEEIDSIQEELNKFNHNTEINV